MAKRTSKAGKSGPSVSPTCSCLLLCDDVVISHARDKHRLDGVIGAITVPFVPHPVAGGVVYARVSNVHQNQRITVAFQRADDGQEPLWAIEAEIVNRNEPLDVHTLIAKVPPFIVHEGGRYVLEARYKGVPIATAPIVVVPQLPRPPAGWGTEASRE